MTNNKPKKKTVKRHAARRKQTGVEGLLEAIVEAALAAAKLYRRAKPIVKQIKPRKRKTNGNKNKSV